MAPMPLHSRTLPPGFIAPCLPSNAATPPSGKLWLHEVKHDGFRVIARKAGERVRLYSRPGNDLTYRFPLIVESLARLRSRSCIIDGKAVACSEDGIACFDHIRYRRHDGRYWSFSKMAKVANILTGVNVATFELAAVGARLRRCANAGIID